MTTIKTEVRQQAQSSSQLKDRQLEALAGWLMAGPAILLLLGFLIVPFFLAFYYSFTNQRLISPNPTEFVGTQNFERLLTVKVLRLEPLVDDAGQPVLDKDGNPTSPVNGIHPQQPDYPQYNVLKIGTS
jgi:multiple sugar transport system permease protein